MKRENKVTVYLSDDEFAAIQALRRKREKIPSLSALLIELIWDGMPTDAQIQIRRERNGESGR